MSCLRRLGVLNAHDIDLGLGCTDRNALEAVKHDRWQGQGFEDLLSLVVLANPEHQFKSPPIF